jgi:cell migration-inducing and hyaluronan-binding protein
LEDGNEVNNTLRHNLGLVTKAGTLIPSDRNNEMCKEFALRPWPFNVDSAGCNGVSTFWISHPDNIFENNSAAGSEQVGFYLIFYREPTGSSVGLLPAFHGERSPLLKFSGNRGHSNPDAAFLLDSGVKITNASDSDPRDVLAIIDLERYAPHVDRNLSLPRVPAEINDFIAYKNNRGIFLRGGDVWISAAQLSDNDVAVIMASESTLPYDAGSHQRLFNSIVVGRSEEDGNSSWSKRGGPCVGIQIQDGPILVVGNKFYNFTVSAERNSYAIGFLPENSGISSPANIIGYNSFYSKSVKVSIGGTVKGTEPDGDLTRNLFDATGSLTGVPGSYIIRPDNPLLMSTSCQTTTTVPPITFCPAARFGLLFVNVTARNLSLNIREITATGDPSPGMTLTGVIQGEPEVQLPTTTQFQPVIVANSQYRLTWNKTPVPSFIDLSTYRLNLMEYTQLELCYPRGTTFNVSSRVWDQTLDRVVSKTDLTMTTDLSTFLSDGSGKLYHWNAGTGLLTLKLVTSWQTSTFDYCPTQGCRFVSISANMGSSQELSCPK